jgi:hypothetical protein
MKLVELQRAIDAKRDNVARVMQDDLINALTRQGKTDDTELQVSSFVCPSV